MAAPGPVSRKAGDLPRPQEHAGTADPTMPFEHIVVVMMENHSFDNLLGDLGRTRSDVKALTFNGQTATDENPGSAKTLPVVRSFPLTDLSQANHITQSWKATHEQINDGHMDGFVRSVDNAEPMGYYTPDILPFAYSLADTFTVGDRWFCSVPGPTYPNRRFMLAGTAYGSIETNPLDAILEGSPPHGTILDELSKHHISWRNYFTDMPMSFTIPSSAIKHLDHMHTLEKFLHDCESGSLPAVSFVDPAVGIFSSIAKAIAGLPGFVKDALRIIGADFSDAPPNETEEDPANMYDGEVWAYKVLEAILNSPAWKDTLVIYTYDEHGGYYDHIPPPEAIPPDHIPPRLPDGEPAGAYDKYGVRVPGVVASPHAKPRGVTSEPHDHTSILATIEHKWNLPALTERDAQANTVMDFLEPGDPQLLTPPKLTEPPKLPSTGSTAGQ
jgi:phospholipase C